MPKDYIGSALKYAHTPEEAAKLLGKFDKKLNIIIDKRGSVLSNVSINEET
jgi:hypothetical protein